MLDDARRPRVLRSLCRCGDHVRKLFYFVAQASGLGPLMAPRALNLSVEMTPVFPARQWTLPGMGARRHDVSSCVDQRRAPGSTITMAWRAQAQARSTSPVAEAESISPRA